MKKNEPPKLKYTPADIEKYGFEAIDESLQYWHAESYNEFRKMLETKSYRDIIRLDELSKEELDAFRKAVQQWYSESKLLDSKENKND
ncbi:MAG: hypothetical protein R2688_07110 [Fimbriimonadaceae bacterium]